MISLGERTVVAGKYRLIRELSRGGMGAVWVAHHLALEEDVAIKFMSAAIPDLADGRARFAREARVAARLRGPHVVQVLDHGVDDDQPYLVMELLHGENLGERLERQGRLPLRAVATIAEQLGWALERAHRAGVVHRDLKPANVFLACQEGREVVKLLDFGIVKELDRAPEGQTRADVLLGSPQYMSPEQARSARDLDHRADLWSLGAVLYRAVTGEVAFDGVSSVDVIVRICTGPSPRPSRLVEGLPPGLDAFFRRAFERDRRQRFTSASEMVAAFSALVSRTASPRPSDLAPAPTTERSAVDADPLPFGPPRAAAVPDDLDAFVERAFSALLGPPGDDAPETTRPLLRRLGVERPDGPSHSGPRRIADGVVSTLIEAGFAALGRGEPREAQRAWEEALGLDPGNRVISLNLRRLATLNGRRDSRPPAGPKRAAG